MTVVLSIAFVLIVIAWVVFLAMFGLMLIGVAVGLAGRAFGAWESSGAARSSDLQFLRSVGIRP